MVQINAISLRKCGKFAKIIENYWNHLRKEIALNLKIAPVK